MSTGCVSFEPAFAVEVEWVILECLARLGHPEGTSSYLRLSTRPVQQHLAEVPTNAAARERRRRHLLAGAYTLRSCSQPDVTLVGMGATVTEVLSAAEQLRDAGHAVEIVCVTCPQRVFNASQARMGLSESPSWILDQVFPVERAAPMVTVVDGHPHALSFLANINRVRAKSLGVTRFGQVGSLDDVYRYHGIDADSIVRAALDLIA